MSDLITYGKHGPHAEGLSDAELCERLRRTEIADRRSRMDPADYHQRRGVNVIHYDLFAEAVRRGLRDPLRVRTRASRPCKRPQRFRCDRSKAVQKWTP